MIKAFLIATLYFLVIDLTAINLFIVKIYKSNLPSFIEVGSGRLEGFCRSTTLLLFK